MKKAFQTILAAAVVAGCASTPAPRKAFTEADTNGDGYVSWEEYSKYYPRDEKKTFIEFDENRDQRLDVNEWEAGVGYRF